MLSADRILIKDFLHWSVSVDLDGILSLKSVSEWTCGATRGFQSIHFVLTLVGVFGDPGADHRPLTRFA
jgi:hypothetical protein